MSVERADKVDRRHWSIDDLHFEKINHAKIVGDETLFNVLASASLIESGSDIYTKLLVDHFGDRSEISNWLMLQWEPEELQHGRALRLYIKHAWPEFDWDGTYKKFLAEYSTYCSPTMLEPSRARELVARCVVETGTAALYRALHEYTTEPVLKQLTAHIWSDEVRHYKHFYRYFLQCNLAEGAGRWKVLLTLGRRLAEIRDEDADCALRHVFHASPYQGVQDTAHFKSMSARSRALVTRNMTAEMMVKMFLKPLDLPIRLRPYIQRPLASVMQRFLAA
jgi:hypothetical protein